jgi:lysophospholipase L1-like esterase
MSKRKDRDEPAESDPKPRSKLLFFAAIMLVFSILLVEGAAHAIFYLSKGMLPRAFAKSNFYHLEHHYMTDHPYLPYIATQGKYGGMEFNSLGDRGAEPEDPKRRIRLIAFGESSTFDASHAWDETWPGYLQHLLGKDKYEVINAAQNGAATPDSLVNLALIHVDLKPDYVLAYHGNNDLESSFDGRFKSDYSHRRRKIADTRHPVFDGMPRWLEFSALYVALRLAMAGPQPTLWGLFTRPGGKADFKNGPFGLETFRRNLRSINAIAQENGAKLVLGTFVYYKPWAYDHMYVGFAEGWRRGIDLHNKIIRELAATHPNIHLAEIEGSFAPTRAHMLDFCHLTETGNKLIAKAFYEEIKRIEGKPASHPDLAAYERLKTADLPHEMLRIPVSAFENPGEIAIGAKLEGKQGSRSFKGNVVAVDGREILVKVYKP